MLGPRGTVGAGMTKLQIEVLGWIAVIFIAASIALWLANAVFKIVKDPDARRNLNRAVGGTMLGGLAAGVGAMVTSPGEIPEPQPSQPASAAPQAETTAPPSLTPAAPPARPDQETPPDPAPQLATLALPPRPFLDDPLGKNYPPCVAKLRQTAAAGMIDRQAAQTCYNHLQDFNDITILLHEERRRAYIPAVKARSKAEADTKRLEFLVEEFASFTYGAEWDRYQAISSAFSCDKHLLINLKDHGLLGERAGCPRPLT